MPSTLNSARDHDMQSDRSGNSTKKKKKSHKEKKQKEPTVNEILNANGIGDEVIDHIIIQKIFKKYGVKPVDSDKSSDSDDEQGLNKNQMRQFIRDTLIEMGQVVKERDQFDEGDFNRLFRQFDRKNTGIISKGDLLVFVKTITGL